MSLGSEDLQIIVDHIIKGKYPCLNTLDVSHNRIWGVEGGKAIA